MTVICVVRFKIRAPLPRALASAVDLYWSRQGQLPSSLAALSQERGIQVNRVDPESGRPYDYRVIGENSSASPKG